MTRMHDADWADGISKKIMRGGAIATNALFRLAAPVSVAIILVTLARAILRG